MMTAGEVPASACSWLWHLDLLLAEKPPLLLVCQINRDLGRHLVAFFLLHYSIFIADLLLFISLIHFTRQYFDSLDIWNIIGNINATYCILKKIYVFQYSKCIGQINYSDENIGAFIK